ncbi:short-subunit dehydrogenase [Siphonobacter sp. SORGH_AS 1065]|nr:short-subunit dehydrogenase [Siphonobacter sp. SORGH_AS_1065]
MDVDNIEETKSKLEHLTQTIGKIDLMIFCAGLGGDNEQLNTEREIEIVKTNITGFTFVLNWFYHFFDKQRYGHIVAITSVAGLRGNRISPAYFASKAFQINYLEALKQKSYKTKSNITITDIRPGFVATTMLSRKDLPWTVEPTEAAQKIVASIKKQRKIVYITKRWLLIAMLLKITPSIIYNRL